MHSHAGAWKPEIIAFKTSGYESSDHFLDVGKMVALGKGGQREIADVVLAQ
jgi:DNA-damage-inducible protein D